MGLTQDIAQRLADLDGIIMDGIRIFGGTPVVTTTVTVTDSSVDCQYPVNIANGFANVAAPSKVGRMFLTRVAVSNCGVGVLNPPHSAGSHGMVSLGDSLLSGNSTGISNSPGETFYTAGNNHLVGNGTDVDGTVTLGGVY